MLEVRTGGARLPLSLRERARAQFADIDAKRTASVAGLIAVASISGAEAQQVLPPANVEAPVARPKPAASKPSTAQVRARTALRRAASQQQTAQVAPIPFPNAGGLEPDASPYADPAAPYKANRVASGKFTEPLVNTPRTITVLTKEVLEDKNATTLRDVARSTAGITLGTGEGGNAFGDRFFIRGFDARNDVFIDGIRDPAISVRENFFTEQIEILRGPASTFAGRGTAGGAINIVTKQAGDKSFQKMETQIGNANQKRVTFDVNQVISPTLSLRGGGLMQDSNVPGRNYVTDDRHGGFVAAKWTPLDTVKVEANFVHTYLKGLPDFGVPYNRLALKPVTDVNVPRETWYGFVYRDFQKAQQDFGTISTEVKIAPWVTFTNKSRLERSVLDYVGVLPNNPQPAGNPTTVTLSSQSRYQVTKTAANVSDFTFKYDTGEVKHATIAGAEFSREAVSRDTYANLTAELNNALPGGPTVSIFNPPNLAPFAGAPQRAYNVTDITVDTKAAYLIETANWRDFIILNGGARVDDYSIKGVSRTASSGTDSTMFNWNVGAVLKPLPYGSVYGAYATSSNPVGAELDATGAAYGGLVVNNTTFQALAPEVNKAGEVGTKWELIDRHLLVTAALFQTTKENARETSGANIIAGASYRVQGLDIGVTGNLTPEWSVFGGYVNMESEVLKSINAAEVGARLANIAHQSFSLMSKYKTGPWEVGGQAIFASHIFGGTFGAINGNVLPSHWRFDAFAEYKLNKNFTAKLFVNNIFDTVYYDAFYRSASPFVFIAPGRSIVGVLAAKF